MWIFFIFIIISAVSLYICRNNYKNRSIELYNNLKNFNQEIEELYYSMPNNHQEKFLSLLNPKWKNNFLSILTRNFNYANNVWALQNQIAEQEELFIALQKFSGKI
ncbi:hypothetical protein FDF74_01165 [Clostridium niameyense]|uniref:DUF4363 family protein n=1 Tax=Clostridium niameyense TaxID=1622073 RepID=A0A6M0R6J7_9CLOT|nr:hypothetical protein [Clostridium niameyense]NEZ45816.1 hypothetical protein [Clostridium niameyense]